MSGENLLLSGLVDLRGGNLFSLFFQRYTFIPCQWIPLATEEASYPTSYLRVFKIFYLYCLIFLCVCVFLRYVKFCCY